MFTFPTRTVALLSATTVAALAATGCGSDGDPATTSTAARAAGTSASSDAVDRAFVSQMIPHHRMAVEMAGYAPDRAERPEIAQLGRSIVASQATEITEMEAIAKRLGAAVAEEPSHSGGGTDHGMHGGGAMAADAKTLGVPMDEMGMSMDMASLAKADPFDRAFIDLMIPHHRGAIVMARAELARGRDAGLKKIATAIVAAQTAEIERMNAWRERWYGAASPAGGVPPA